MKAARLILTAVAAGLLAVPAAVPAVLLHNRGDLDPSAWISAVLCAWGASLCLLVSEKNGSPQGSLWAGLTALTVAAWAPLAATSAAQPLRADLAFLAAASAVALSRGTWNGVRFCGAFVLAVSACALDATALVWPIGAAWSAWTLRRDRPAVSILLLSSLAAVAAVAAAHRPIFSTSQILGGGYDIHRDTIVLLPVIFLGLIGLLNGPRRHASLMDTWWLPGWAAVTLLSLLLIVATVPLDSRLVVLAMWWLMPCGCAELAGLARMSGRSSRVARGVALLLIVLVAGLGFQGARLWLESVLLVFCSCG